MSVLSRGLQCDAAYVFIVNCLVFHNLLTLLLDLHYDDTSDIEEIGFDSASQVQPDEIELFLSDLHQ